MIGHRTLSRENDDLPQSLASSDSSGHKEAAIFYVRALITREIRRSKDPKCKAGIVIYPLC